MFNNVFNIMKLKDVKTHPQPAVHESVPFGILLAIVGGFLDAYTYIGRGGVFANAQTGNIVLIGIYASEGKWGKALVPIPPILACVIGVIFAEWIKNKSPRAITLDWQRAILVFEIIVLFIIGFIPYTVSNSVVNVTISFIASVQVSSFRKLVDSPYATTMCTGNLKSASEAAYAAFTQKDHKAAVRSIRYFIIIFSFIMGAFLGGFLTLNIGIKAIWCAAAVLASAFILFCIGEEKNI